MHPRDASAYSQSRRLPRSIAVIDDRRLAYVRLGSGSPTIVFLSGAGMDIDSWFKVLPEAATMGTVIAYDRPGVGRSDRPAVAQSGDVIVETLRRLLAQVAPPPYVIVAHSLGGLPADLFARHHPDDVAALVLVEAASPDEAANPPAAGSIARVVGAIGRVLGRLRGRADGLDEVDNVAETIRQIGAAPAFPDVPLVVVTGGTRMRMVPEAAFHAHQLAQAGRVALSPQGRHVIAEGSGHFPQLQEPEIVVAAIRDVVERSRRT